MRHPQQGGGWNQRFIEFLCTLQKLGGGYDPMFDKWDAQSTTGYGSKTPLVFLVNAYIR